MAATIPLPLVGKHVASVLLTPQIVASGGGVSSGTSSVASTTSLKVGLSFNIDPIKEAINGDASTKEHNIVLADNYSVDLEIFTVNNGTSPFKLYDAIVQSDILKLSFTVGTGASQRTVNIYGSRGPLTWNSTGRGRVVETLRLDAIDTGEGADAPFIISS